MLANFSTRRRKYMDVILCVLGLCFTLGVLTEKSGRRAGNMKGGWETDESMEQAALRETLEEAGIVGNVESKLGRWFYKRKLQATTREGYMFHLLVNKQLENWSAMNFRKRRWVDDLTKMFNKTAEDICKPKKKEIGRG